MSNALNGQELTRVLEEIIKELQKKGILGSDVDPLRLARDTADLMQNEGIEITAEDLKSSEMKKKLSLAVIGQNLNDKNPLDKPFNIAKILSPKLSKEELKDEIKNVLNIVNKNKPTPQKRTEKDLDEVAEKMSEYLIKKKEAKAEPAVSVNSLYQELNEAIRCLYGVAIAGEVQKAVYYVPGNPTGMISQIPGSDPNSSFMEDQNIFDGGKPDPNGLEAITKSNLMGFGDFWDNPTVSDSIENAPYRKGPGSTPTNTM